MSYWFFFSYAHANDDNYLQKFYEDLAAEVGSLTGAAQSKIGFIDRKAIEHGAEWDTSLEQGLQNCRVFVPIYSPSYFLSEYCGKELKIFRDRLRANSIHSEPLILPVLWNQESNILARLPATINSIQYKHGNYPNEYTTEGVLQMVRLGLATNSKFYNEYWDFIRKFAVTIVDAASNHSLLPLAQIPPLETVEGVFPSATRIPSATPSGEKDPRYVQFIFVASKRDEMQGTKKDLKFYGNRGGSDWQPFLDTYRGSAAALAIETVESFSKDLHYEEVVLEDGVVEQIKKAARQGKIVVVVADTWTLKLERYIDLITPLDEYTSMNCITLILWNDSDLESSLEKEKLKVAIQGAFKTKSALSIKNFFPDSIKSCDGFKTELIRALADAQAKILETAQVCEKWKYVIVNSQQSVNFSEKPLLN